MPPPNDQLDLALLSGSNRVCVISAPGSGKTTRVLLPKITALIDSGVAQSEMVLLTFSRVSAADLKGKVGTVAPLLKTGTVHSLALSFLISENNHAVRARIETILMDFEKPILISDLAVVLAGFDRNTLKKLFSEFSAGWATQQEDQIFIENDDRRRFKAAVMGWLHEHHTVTMEEIMYHAVNLARQLPDAALIDEPQYILVDEFQDLNRLEQEFIEQLARRSRLLLIVGDPDQSIYSFKYAHPAGIEEFAGTTGVDAFRHNVTLRCPEPITEVAAQLLQQISPGRVSPLISGCRNPGEVHFVVRNTQEEEFEYIINSIVERLRAGVAPSDIAVLVPKKDLGRDFADAANASLERLGLLDQAIVDVTSKNDISPVEQKAVLKFGIIAKPDSVLRARTLLGLEDGSHFAREFDLIKRHYGNIEQALAQANAADFPTRQIRVRRLCGLIQELRNFCEAHQEVVDLRLVIDEIFPVEDTALTRMRTLFLSLIEEGDTLSGLYAKFIDHTRNIPADAHTIRVMTLLASKGLGVNHVYIIGCNSGNIPGSNHSSHLTDREYFEEQGRLLYVGFTRAQSTLTVSWSRNVPYAPALRQRTGTLATRRIGGQLYAHVGLSEFLQNLANVRWE